MFPKYLYCFTCHQFTDMDELDAGALIQCPKCQSGSVHSCMWILHHHDECFWKLDERNVTIQAFSIYLTHCKDCEHRFYCMTNRIENDWDMGIMMEKGWDFQIKPIPIK